MVWHVVEDVCKDEAVQISGHGVTYMYYMYASRCETFLTPSEKEVVSKIMKMLLSKI
jgi:hypothetical protein